jgi:hypothetical protein
MAEESAQKKQCPKFVDFTRECLKEIEFPVEHSIEYFCTNEKHSDCPFYKILSGNPEVCKNIAKCPAFKNFKLSNFTEFIEMSEAYCVRGNHLNCRRYVMKDRGEVVPPDLHPDGRTIAGWK